MSFITDSIQKLSNQLYPNGRAFRMPLPGNEDDGYTDESGVPYTDESGVPYVTEFPLESGGILFRLHRALGISEAQVWTDARSIYDSIFPDNPNFTADDATIWEERLGIVTNNTDLTTRIQAIVRKMNYPGTAAPRQSAAFLQSQLQAAGFNLFVYPNKFSDGMGGFVRKSPSDVLGLPDGEAIYNNFDYGNIDYGDTYELDGVSLIANHIEESKDSDFVIGSSYAYTFFIAGSTITTFASVPLARKTELRQLILTLKRQQNIGFLFINYV